VDGKGCLIDSEVKIKHFGFVKATLTELRRETGRVLGTVVHGKKAVELTEHGETVADIHPRPRPMSGPEFAAAWRKRKPLGKETAETVATGCMALWRI